MESVSEKISSLLVVVEETWGSLMTLSNNYSGSPEDLEESVEDLKRVSELLASISAATVTLSFVRSKLRKISVEFQDQKLLHLLRSAITEVSDRSAELKILSHSIGESCRAVRVLHEYYSSSEKGIVPKE